MDPTAAAKRLDCVRVGLHVGQLFQRIPAGIGRVTELLYEELPRHAHVVAFASCSPSARRVFDTQVADGVEFRSVGSTSPRWRYEMWQRFRRPLLDLDIDVCHAPSLAVPPTTAPLVVSINDVAFLRHPETFTRHGVRFHERGLAIARREAAAIIVPSEFTRRELLREGFDARRIHRIPLSVRGPAPAAADLSDVLRRRGVRPPYLLAVGTVEPRKGHATIVAAFERLRARHPDLSLVIAGAVGWLPKQQVCALRRPGVVALEQVDNDELDALYASTEVVVNASIYEGFGLTVLEGLARGRPVVATAIPSHVEVAGGVARLFSPGDVDGLELLIDRLLRDSTARAELGRAGLERARRFDVATTIEAHVAVYERVSSSGH
jgi:glycosyltransferase involved in cell wall biosynthesis